MPKLLMIKPSQILDGAPLKFEKSLSPTRALPYLAGLTPPDFDITLIDDSVEDVDFDADVDLVALTSILPQVPRAMEIADRFRARGIPVIMGGTGACSVPDYVTPHVDVLVRGEAEYLWSGILNDFRQGTLKPVYEADKPFTMENMVPARFDLMNQDCYMRASRAASKQTTIRIPIETSRGCPHNCDFCFVTRYFGRKMRFRPIDEVVEELRQFPESYVFFVDDNICINPERAKELFRALIPLKIRWISSSHILAARDPELLRLAAASGCVGLFIGLESLSAENLASVNKSFNLKRDVAVQLNAFRDAGINPLPNLVFGFDGDTPESIYTSFDFMRELKIKMVYSFILTPLPGTVLHERMQADGRILHEDYSLYDTAHVVFQPKHMSPDTLYNTYIDAYAKFYSGRSIVQRFSEIQPWLKPSLLPGRLHCLGGNLFFRQCLKRGIHPMSAGIPKR
ncbi:MAG: B12-binding domain-containing radical SAM protein [Verrucomicrobia bacterium]|jgi:radical SAM superfamily enzyme YgiQ (UPF0313 family)|nr:B12-binding domain-containing radical SAM protein [Verrucomicrobiota bacterium]